MSNIQIYKGDCLEVMNNLIQQGIKVDAIITDLPYGTAKNSSKNNHPNEKNVDLIEFLIKVLSNKGDIVFDPFMGSGSSGLACKRCERNFIGVDINEELVEVTRNRLNESNI